MWYRKAHAAEYIHFDVCSDEGTDIFSAKDLCFAQHWVYTHKTFPYFLFRYSLGACNCAWTKRYKIVPHIILSDSVISSRNRSDYALYATNIYGITVHDALKLLLLLWAISNGPGQCERCLENVIQHAEWWCVCALPVVCKTVNLLEVSIIFVVVSI